MSEFLQLTLPGMPVRLVISAVWDGPERLCTVRATLDAPSDQFTSQMSGADLEGKFTAAELGDVMSTLAYELVKALGGTLDTP